MSRSSRTLSPHPRPVGRPRKRGFGSPTFNKQRQREIASKGGRRAHEIGTAHEWTSEEAREAGRKGGLARAIRKAEADVKAMEAAAVASVPTAPATLTEV